MKGTFSRRRRGFTLIEMLTVFTIIVTLAVLGFGTLNCAREKSGRDKARVQVDLLANACDKFKADHGFYPGTNDNPAGDGTGMTKGLYRDLYWNPGRDASGPKSDPKPEPYLSELNPEHNQQVWTDGSGQNVRILDPWNHEFRYRKGPNEPGFELWSRRPDGATNPA